MEKQIQQHKQLVDMDTHCLKCWVGTALFIIIAIILLKLYFRGGVCRIKKDLSGKIAVVTGGNAGIGKETIEGLLQNKCRVIFGSRDIKKNEEVVQEFKKNIPGALVESYRLDLSDRDSVQQFVKNLKSSCDHIDILVNNAGVCLPDRRLTKDGKEMTINVNHFGHFYLTHLVWDYILKSKQFRVINVTSKGNTYPDSDIDFDDIDSVKNDYQPMTVYKKSKMANVLFTKQMQRKISQKKLNGLSVCLHPGVVDTEIMINYCNTSFKRLLFQISYIFFWIMIKIFLKTSKQGAQTSLYLALQNIEKLKGGQYYADCNVAKPGNQAFDEQAAKRLWRVSEDRFGIQFKI